MMGSNVGTGVDEIEAPLLVDKAIRTFRAGIIETGLC